MVYWVGGRFIWLLYFAAFVQCESEDNLMTTTSAIIKNVGKFQSTMINFVILDDRSILFFDELMKIQDKLETKRSSVKISSDKRKLFFEKVNVIITEHPGSLMQIFQNETSENLSSHGYFFAIVLNNSNLRNILVTFFLIIETLKINNFCVIFKENSTIIASCSSPFNKYCNNKGIKAFTTLIFTPDSTKLFPSSIKEMKNCSMRVATFNLPPFIIIQGSTLSGRDINLMTSIAQSLNLEINYKIINGSLPWGYLFENGTGTGAIEILLNNETDMILGDYFLKLDRLEYFDNSASYFESKLAFIIPQRAPLSSFQKLLQPFEHTVWWIFVACLIFGVFVIFLVVQHNKMKEIVIGSDETSPVMNMLSVILGYSQSKIPSNSFGRFILMMFMIFCLVMRSIYQGSLYKFLQSDGSHLQVKSFDEMIAKNFKFYIGKSFVQLIEQQTNIKNK